MSALDIQKTKEGATSADDYREALKSAGHVYKFGLVEVCDHLVPCPECKSTREDPERSDDADAIGCGLCKDAGLIERKDEHGGGDLDGFALPFVVSTEAVDRDNDTINPKGWSLKAFRKNPVVLFGHDSRSLPVARAPDTSRDKDRNVLRSVAIFPAQELHAFGNLVGRLFRQKFLNAASVGFRPTEFAQNEERGGFFPTDFKKQELLEWSAVPIPSNPEALVEARSAGFDLAPLVRWAEEALEQTGDGGLYVPRARLEDMRKRANGDRLVFAVSKTGEIEPIAFETKEPAGEPAIDFDAETIEWPEVCERMALALQDGDEGARAALAKRYADLDIDAPTFDDEHDDRALAEVKRFGVVLPWATDPDKAAEIVANADLVDVSRAAGDEPADAPASDDVETVDTSAHEGLDKPDEAGESLSEDEGRAYAVESLRTLLGPALKEALSG